MGSGLEIPKGCDFSWKNCTFWVVWMVWSWFISKSVVSSQQSVSVYIMMYGYSTSGAQNKLSFPSQLSKLSHSALLALIAASYIGNESSLGTAFSFCSIQALDGVQEAIILALMIQDRYFTFYGMDIFIIGMVSSCFQSFPAILRSFGDLHLLAVYTFFYHEPIYWWALPLTLSLLLQTEC